MNSGIRNMFSSAYRIESQQEQEQSLSDNRRYVPKRNREYNASEYNPMTKAGRDATTQMHYTSVRLSLFIVIKVKQ